VRAAGWFEVPRTVWQRGGWPPLAPRPLVEKQSGTQVRALPPPREPSCATRIGESGSVTGPAWSERLEPGAQKAEFVAFWIGQDVLALGAGLADIGGSGTES